MNQERLTKMSEHERDKYSRSVVSIRYEVQLKQLVRDLNELPTDSPSIYMDASGIGNDLLDDLQLFVAPTNILYLVDMELLGDTVFSAVGDIETSLRLVLESKGIPKAGFDIRDLSQLLFRQHNILLAGIYDIQLMELASRKKAQYMKFLSGLAKRIHEDIPSSDDRKMRWLNPEYTSNLHLYNLLQHATTYVMKRVEMFPILWSIYNRNLSRPKNAVWYHLAKEESEQRVYDSKKNTSHPRSKCWGPEVFWNEEQRQAAIGAWNDEKLLDKRLGRIEFCDN